jgi:hypothetical protein
MLIYMRQKCTAIGITKPTSLARDTFLVAVSFLATLPFLPESFSMGSFFDPLALGTFFFLTAISTAGSGAAVLAGCDRTREDLRGSVRSDMICNDLTKMSSEKLQDHLGAI